ncbi:uncharacterized protein LOC122058346 [Macadamia integrifolia]|uniref:uncharacterized protein LOC122058346 n=1 Tax=Macadamia integrifolia TaxID=60698 RepID=UPI001C527337|nr:uncharacterized protein LOC122058346 [Macadamia integrifolia]
MEHTSQDWVTIIHGIHPFSFYLSVFFCVTLILLAWFHFNQRYLKRQLIPRLDLFSYLHTGFLIVLRFTIWFQTLLFAWCLMWVVILRWLLILGFWFHPLILFPPLLFSLNSTMKILSWNVRGLHSSLTKRCLSNHIKKQWLDVVFVCETKIQDHLMFTPFCSVKVCDCSNFINSARTTGKKGGLWVLFSNSLRPVSVTHGSFFFFITFQTGQLFSNNWGLVCLYGSPQAGPREAGWKELFALLTTVAFPCVFIGDFNESLHQDHKFGGIPSRHCASSKLLSDQLNTLFLAKSHSLAIFLPGLTNTHPLPSSKSA